MPHSVRSSEPIFDVLLALDTNSDLSNCREDGTCQENMNLMKSKGKVAQILAGAAQGGAENFMFAWSRAYSLPVAMRNLLFKKP